ncbi:MAG TPA: hypothetical protein VFF65_03185, partial [Phycisphaerales bacterium]|nr:hypothetical protein [Phycisphaerales bacterium]
MKLTVSDVRLLKLIKEHQDIAESGDDPKRKRFGAESAGNYISTETVERECAPDPMIHRLTYLHAKGFVEHPTGDEGTANEKAHTLTTKGTRELAKYIDGGMAAAPDVDPRQAKQIDKLIPKKKGQKPKDDGESVQEEEGDAGDQEDG